MITIKLNHNNTYLTEVLLVSGERYEKDFLVINYESVNIMIRIKSSY